MAYMNHRPGTAGSGAVLVYLPDTEPDVLELLGLE